MDSRYTDPPEVVRKAAVLAGLPHWYLALMLARVMNRKTPARTTADVNGVDVGGQGREAIAQPTW